MEGYFFPKLRDLVVNESGYTGYGDWINFSEEEKMANNKTFKRKMVIEIEGKNEDVVKNEFNFLKAFFERNRDALHCKCKIKEID